MGSWPARWPPDSSLLYSSSPPRSSRQRRTPSLAQCCADSRWVGRCWPCFRCGSPTNLSDGPRLLHLLMGLSGLLLVGFGSPVREVLNWVWPPAMVASTIWMIVWVHRQLRSPSRRWMLYPVIALLALASLGGGYETLRAAADATAYPMPGQLIDVAKRRWLAERITPPRGGRTARQGRQERINEGHGRRTASTRRLERQPSAPTMSGRDIRPAGRISGHDRQASTNTGPTVALLTSEPQATR